MPRKKYNVKRTREGGPQVKITYSTGKPNRTGKTISRTYYKPNGDTARKTFIRNKPYQQERIFRSGAKFGGKIDKKCLDMINKLDKRVDEIVADVTSECFNAIRASAPYDTGDYYAHIAQKSPRATLYGDIPDNERIHIGVIWVKNDKLPFDDITYVDLARFLEFGTGAKEITGSGNPEYHGMKAQPHWIPNYEIYKKVLRDRLKRLNR